MARSGKRWVYTPAKPSVVPEALKQQVSVKVADLVEQHIKPKHVEPPPKTPQFNYIVDIYTKWRGGSLYFIARYASPGPNSIAPFFETGFARIEYAGNERFHLAYFRHTGKWWQVHFDLTLDEALDFIKDGGIFQP